MLKKFIDAGDGGANDGRKVMKLPHTKVVYQHSSNSISGGSTGWLDHCAWPEVTWQEETRTGSIYSAHAQPVPALFSYYDSSTNCSTVVQVPLLPEVNEGHVTSEGWKGVRIRSRKLLNIRPSEAFSPEVMSSPIRLPLELEVTWSEVY